MSYMVMIEGWEAPKVRELTEAFAAFNKVHTNILKEVGEWLNKRFQHCYRGSLVEQHNIDTFKEGRMP